MSQELDLIYEEEHEGSEEEEEDFHYEVNNWPQAFVLFIPLIILALGACAIPIGLIVALILICL
jgi:hypothetical protein